MIWTKEQLQKELLDWGVDAQLKAGTAKKIANYYEEKKNMLNQKRLQGNDFQNGFCLAIEALMSLCIDKCKKKLVMTNLEKMMDIQNKERTFFEILSAKNFTNNQRAQMCEDMADILSYHVCNPCKVIDNIAYNGILELYWSDKTKENTCKIMAQRLNKLNCFIKSVAENQAYENYQTICLTGSDPHIGNKQVLIITKEDGTKVVYKPHAVGAEQLLSEIIQIFNQYYQSHAGYEDLTLPVMKAETKILSDNKTQYGEVQFVEKTDTMSPIEAKKYYQKMGVLICIAKLLGLTDLHQDNIMATKEGPVILDAECILTPEILGDCRFNETNLNMALNQATVPGDERANAAFRIFDGRSYKESNIAYKEYRDELCMGFFEGKRAFHEISERVTELIIEWVTEETATDKKLEKIRWVPISTADLQCYSYSYAENMDTRWKDGAETQLLVQMHELSKEEVYDKNWRNICGKMTDALVESIKNGDIPYFTISYTDNNTVVFCDNTEIYTLNQLKKLDIQRIIRENGRQLLSGGWDKYITEFLALTL